MGLYKKILYMFVQKNSLGKKITPFSRLNYVIFIKKFIIPFKRRLFFILIFIIFVIVMFRGYIKLFNI